MKQRLTITKAVLFLSIFFGYLTSNGQADFDTVCSGAEEFYKVVKTDGSKYTWITSSGGTIDYGAETMSDSIMVTWKVTDQLSTEFVKVLETNKYGRIGDTITLNILVAPVPTAVISGSDTLFDGNTGTNKISISLTGTAPWSIEYNDGKSNITIKDIESSPFTLETRSLSNPPEIHKFTLVTVKNESGCSGVVSGVAEITVSPPVKTSKIIHN
jgi:hypothetical protein